MFVVHLSLLEIPNHNEWGIAYIRKAVAGGMCRVSVAKRNGVFGSSYFEVNYSDIMMTYDRFQQRQSNPATMKKARVKEKCC